MLINRRAWCTANKMVTDSSGRFDRPCDHIFQKIPYYELNSHSMDGVKLGRLLTIILLAINNHGICIDTKYIYECF